MTLKKARLKANLTQEQLAKLLGIGQGHLSEIEQGHKMPSLELANKITEKFPQVTIRTLLGLSG